jgi:hypothetical protein
MPTSHDLCLSARTLRRSVVAILGLALLGASSLAAAETAKEKELEARVAELEKLVQQLVAEKKAAPAAVAAPAPAPAAGAVAAAPAKPDPKAIQPGTILPNAAPGTSFVLTGYAKADGMWTNTSDGELAENTPSRDFYVPGATPIGQPDEGTDFDAHVKQTRINFGTDTLLAGGDKLSTRFEIDFFGSATGNQRVTNTYAPVLRHAYVQWREWLVGQTWSNFQDVAALPDSVDFIGSTDGTVFVRQPQVRYTKGGFSLAVENPQTTMTPFGGPSDPNSTAWIVETDDSSIPDLTARYAWKGAWGHVAVAGLARELKYERVATTTLAAIDASTWSMAGSLTGKFMLGKDDIRFMLLGGNLGRYVGLNFTTDAVLTSNGGDADLETIDGFAGSIAYRHVWSDKWRSNVYFSIGDYDNDTGYTGGNVNKSSESWAINTWYTPLPKLDIGAEFRHAVRELENGNDGSLDRLQLTTKYSF